ncbi:MAG: phenylalanine--tRNA ligase subunit beta [Bdellovibrionales bacterium GWA2_49_15]|nr:MAG: phenylalanine--tRNA ligase subunit beta [Bdellovibrionales bacterium GWA2_49_15]HAZ11252.1 phenylalanine--tRNA ligase subunit beta [Bdellovibrionales bacterium]
MHISMDWIRDFVDLPAFEGKEGARKVATRFTMATAEVEEVLMADEYYDRVVVAQIQQVEKHPAADKLNLVTFQYGPGKTHKVVCGAQNVRPGLKVPYAPLDTSLPNGMILTPKNIRGIMSEGMLCSGEELKIPSTIDGLLELPDSAPVGQTLGDYLQKKRDIVFVVDNKSLTHRPDLWGHFGMAREFATAFDCPLKNPFSREWETKYRDLISKQKGSQSPVAIKVDQDSSCLGYYGISIDQIKVTESPEWLKERLNTVGLRPINSIVDISNYVMCELGIPLHIFDREAIEGGGVHIESLKADEEFLTLDEQRRMLKVGDTVIRDQKKTLVLAGIMGGLNSGVSMSTSRIFIEVANWKAAHVRKTSVRLGLRTDSSQRYEKSLDSLMLQRTMYRTIELILQLNPDAKIIGKLEYDGPDLSDRKPLVIATSVSSIVKQLGIEISGEKVLHILQSLDFKVSKDGQLWQVEVPSYRSTKDIECEADIVEEIGRVIGYDNIQAKAPELSIRPVRLTPMQTVHRKIRDYLIFGERCFEVLTYPMVGQDLLRRACINEQLAPKIINALSVDHNLMRPSLIPSLLEAAALNSKNFEKFRLFEIGRIYNLNMDKKKGHFADEKHVLGMVFYHNERTPIMESQNAVERLLSVLNVPFDIRMPMEKFMCPLMPLQWSGKHPFEHRDIMAMGKPHGTIFSVHPLILRNFKLKGHLSLVFLDLSLFEKELPKDKAKYTPLAKFPGTLFDFTVIASEGREAQSIIGIIQKQKVPIVENVSVLDVYALPEGKRAITVRLSFLDREKTLTAEIVKMAEEKILAALLEQGFPLRS